MPSISCTREPMAAPKTTKYSEVLSTGEATLCISVRRMRAISKPKMALTPYQVH